MTEQLTPSAQRVQKALRELGLELRVVELPGSTRTAQDAASAIGCQVGQIAKSLVFHGVQSSQPFLIIASGSNRVDENALAAYVGEPLRKADADFVKQHTGYAIGGVPPVGHPEPFPIYIDQDLLGYAEIWAAAGTPHAVFRLSPEDLIHMTSGQVVSLAKPPSSPDR